MTFVIAEPCVGVMDLSCVEECPVDCIYVGASMAYIHPGECTDCNACVPVCPVDAIYYEDYVPGDWSYYISANADFFSELGSPGGASRIGPLSFDAPQVQSDGKHVVKTPAPHERTTADLDIVQGGYRPGRVLAFPPVRPGGALDTAAYLLFDGIVSIGERAGGAAAQAALDEALLPFDQVSVSRMIESAAAARSAGLLQDLLVKPQSKAIQRAVLDRAKIECAGQLVRKVPYLYDREAVGLVANLVPLMLRFIMRRRGGDVRLATNSFEYASFIRMVMAGPHLERTSAFDAEIVLPDLSEIPRPLLAAFRDSHRDDLADHVNRMVNLANENAALDHLDERRRQWNAARNEIADHGSKLWRMARASFPGVRGDVALGIIGGFASLGSSTESSIVERLLATAGLVPLPNDPAQIFFLTRPGKPGW